MLSARKGTIALLAMLALAVALPASPAGATMPPKKCGNTEVKGKDYKVRAHLIGCDRARENTIDFLKNGKHGKSWNCVKFSPKESKIAFNCRKGSKDYYAIRK